MLPLIWLGIVTHDRGLAEDLLPDPRLGFLAHAASLTAAEQTASTARLIFNDYLDVTVAAFFMASFVVILALLGEGVVPRHQPRHRSILRSPLSTPDSVR